MNLIWFLLITQTLIVSSKVASEIIVTCIDNGNGVGCLLPNASDSKRVLYNKRLASHGSVPVKEESTNITSTSVDNEQAVLSDVDISANSSISSNQALLLTEATKDDSTNDSIANQAGSTNKDEENVQSQNDSMIQVRALKLSTPPASASSLSKKENADTLSSTDSTKGPLLLFLTKDSSSNTSTPQAQAQTQTPAQPEVHQQPPYNSLFQVSSIFSPNHNQFPLFSSVNESRPTYSNGSFLHSFFLFFTPGTTPSSILLQLLNRPNRRDYENKRQSLIIS